MATSEPLEVPSIGVFIFSSEEGARGIAVPFYSLPGLPMMYLGALQSAGHCPDSRPSSLPPFLPPSDLEAKCDHHGPPLSCGVLHEVHAERVPVPRGLPCRLDLAGAPDFWKHHPRVSPGDVKLHPVPFLLLPGTRGAFLSPCLESSGVERVCVCMYVHVHACMCVCMCICVHLCVHVHAHSCKTWGRIRDTDMFNGF